MDALTAIINRAMVDGVVSSFHGMAATQRLSSYGDDVVPFVRPSVRDLYFVREALEVFGEASDL